MSIDQAEQFKQDLTDKWVIVDKTVPELRRFNGLTGRVKTVNMNCRALVEFDGPADIGWYDIAPGFLTVVDTPLPRKSAAAAAPKATPKAAPSATAAAGGSSPLDAIRKAGAGNSGPKPAAAAAGSPLDAIRKAGAVGSGPKPAAAAADSGQQPTAATGTESTLDIIRRQGAFGQSPDAVPETAAAPVDDAPAVAAAPAASEDLSNLSPIEQIRRQGPFKG